MAMIVTITTFHLKRAASLEEMTKVFQGTAPKYQNMAGLLQKNYWVSEDGLRGGGIYLWTSKADADRVYTPEWKKFVESKYGGSPVIEYLYSPVMVGNREGTIRVAAAWLRLRGFPNPRAISRRFVFVEGGTDVRFFWPKAATQMG